MSSSRRMLLVATADELKTSWPEVVGEGIWAAGTKIHGDRPDVLIEIHGVGESVQPGYNDKRVRVFVHKDSIWSVAETPVVG